MANDYPVHLEVSSPARFDRVQLALRIALAIVLAWLGITAGWLMCLLYATLPVVAAIGISSVGSERFASELAPRLWRVLRWLLQLSAFMALLVDRFPTGEDDAVQLDVRITGKPTIGSALSRLVTSLPSGFVLLLLWFVSGILWVIAALLVLLGGPMPPAILAFQRGALRWSARLVAYHASLVEEYPPFSFDTGDGHSGTLAAGAPC
jgi:hypothetical protein